MYVLELSDPDTGAFRARLLRKGEAYGPHHGLVYNQDEPMLEFYGPASGDEQLYKARLLGRYPAEHFRRPRQGRSRLGGGYGVSPANSHDIAAWLERELSRPWTPPSASPRPAEPTAGQPVQLHEAGRRRATLYVRQINGYRKQEAEWVEVTHRPGGKYVVGYLPRRRRTALEMVFRSRPSLVILLGWDHPDLQPQRPPEDYYSDSGGERTLNYTLIETMSIVPNQKDYISEQGFAQLFDSELDAYLAGLPLTQILLDMRGETATARRDLAAQSEHLILHPTGVRDFSSETDETSAHTPAVFVSYYHGADTAAREQFERENGAVIRSSSIYPGEISTGPEVPREIRKRILGCDFVAVLVGRETYSRQWVDWEIHAAVTRDRTGASRPVLGILLPEMAATGALLLSLLDAMPAKTTVTELLRRSDELSRELITATAATMPARLLDNLLAGYASLVPWPASQKALLDALASSVSQARPVNRRRLLVENLPLPPNGPPMPAPGETGTPSSRQPSRSRLPSET
jgi:hypothetical protein